jgi:hypothetical protein
MNRLKLWLFALVVAAGAAVALRSVSIGERDVAIRVLDARLNAAAARAAASGRALARETTAVAALAARDPRLRELLHPRAPEPPPVVGRGRKAPPAPDAPAVPGADDAAVAAAARGAVTAAEGQLGFALPGDAQITAMTRKGLEDKGAQAGAADEELMGFFDAAVKGESRRGWVRWSKKVWYGAAFPAGDEAGLVVLAPADAAWLQGALAGTAADGTLTAPGVADVGTLKSPADAAALVKAAAAAKGLALDAGRLAPVDLRVFGVKLPAVRPLFATAPAHRALATTVEGLPGATLTFSAAALPVVAPVVQAEWTGLAAIVAMLVVALLFGVLVKPSEVAAVVPADLLAAAAKIERGDFTARAPVMAGKLGTVSAALNKAADAAEGGSTRGAAAPSPSLTQEFFAKPEAAAPEAEPSAFEFPTRPRPTPVARAAPEPARAELGGGAFEAAAIPAPALAARGVIAPPPPPPGVPSLTTPVEALQGAARAAAPSEVGDEETHWREVFRDFLRVRQECGEAAEGLTFDRFRQKLESNKTALLTKYGCRTVRFQVYVKEGKAALKATPVK